MANECHILQVVFFKESFSVFSEDIVIMFSIVGGVTVVAEIESVDRAREVARKCSTMVSA